MAECPIYFKRYPIAGQTGYSGCECSPIPSYAIAVQDCEDVNNYKKLPYRAMGCETNPPYEDLSALYNNMRAAGTRMYIVKETCNVNMDPFKGIFVDLYSGFNESGLGGLIEDLCYALKEKYTPGYAPVFIKQKLYPNSDRCDTETPSSQQEGTHSTIRYSQTLGSPPL